MTVYPPRNLPGESENWGREVETRLESLRGQWGSDSQTLVNIERSTGGQLASSTGLIDELLARSTEVITPRDMSVTGNETAEPFPRDYQTVTFSAVPGVRSAFLLFSGWTSSPTNNSPVLFVRFQSQRVLRLVPLVFVGPDETSGIQRMSGFCRIQTPNNLPVDIDLEFARGPGSVSSTVILSGISISLTRSGSL